RHRLDDILVDAARLTRAPELVPDMPAQLRDQFREWFFLHAIQNRTRIAKARGPICVIWTVSPPMTIRRPPPTSMPVPSTSSPVFTLQSGTRSRVAAGSVPHGARSRPRRVLRSSSDRSDCWAHVIDAIDTIAPPTV